jgi:hypothetical protein
VQHATVLVLPTTTLSRVSTCPIAVCTLVAEIFPTGVTPTAAAPVPVASSALLVFSLSNSAMAACTLPAAMLPTGVKPIVAAPPGVDYVNGDFKEKVDNITIQKRNLDTEFVELLERLPWKEWKTYTQAELVGWISKEQELETKFEYVDMFHFFMNIGLLIGITPEELSRMYYLKNKENFDRQERGY